MNCPKCGMAYVTGNAEDEAAHATYCDMMTRSPAVTLQSPERITWKNCNDRIICVTDFSPEDQRILAQDVSLVANREMGYDSGIYHSYDPPDDRCIHLYIYIRGNRALGLLLLERRTHIWRCHWLAGQDADPKCEQLREIDWMWSVGFIWIHPNDRRAGLAERLLYVGLGDLNLSVSEVGWYTPFSEAGEQFVQKQCPCEFYVAK